ncbi:MAG: SDR family oxidoreductase [Chitinophagaceae bacterium]|nr:SDR family oxidoreductase [Chitinophagaceae bacterium]
MNTLKGKTIVITGASKGIGRAVALQVAAAGANLALMARSEQELQDVKKMAAAHHGHCLVFAGDVADEAFVNNTMEATVKKFGRVDIVINNAGFGVFKPSEEISATEWDNVFATNVKGTFLVTNAAIPYMKKNKSGHIINIASDVAKRVFAGGSLYCASKYAQDAYSMAIRKELRPFNIKVSVVYSGLVDSSFHSDPEGHGSHNWWLKNEDMANAIIYMASQPAHVVIDELMIHPLAQEY